MLFETKITYCDFQYLENKELKINAVRNLHPKPRERGGGLNSIWSASRNLYFTPLSMTSSIIFKSILSPGWITVIEKETSVKPEGLQIFVNKYK